MSSQTDLSSSRNGEKKGQFPLALTHGDVSTGPDSVMSVCVCLEIKFCFVYWLRGLAILIKCKSKNSLTEWFNDREEVPTSFCCISSSRRGCYEL